MPPVNFETSKPSVKSVKLVTVATELAHVPGYLAVIVAEFAAQSPITAGVQ